ncbi:MAG TPA: 2-amino-4-hydroxy-6-hydroxymethyldihydropteridine diphosphokinase [Thermoanaerobaculia bacterium]|nr:2-amino-4-hydroxy-6-hydroxymethyldihydropteridine diphosphokinase [Thermoanaerobaculia bacterium]
MIALGLGGNLGPVRDTLAGAVGRLRALLGPLTVASLYRTAPVGPPQPPYLNTAAVGTTRRSPREILALTQELERAAGRRAGGERWGARELDVDLLVYGSRVQDDPLLTLPHPRLRERAFVLVPLAEIAPDLPIPPDGATARQLLAALGPAARHGVERLGSW